MGKGGQRLATNFVLMWPRPLMENLLGSKTNRGYESYRESRSRRNRSSFGVHASACRPSFATFALVASVPWPSTKPQPPVQDRCKNGATSGSEPSLKFRRGTGAVVVQHS